MIICIRMTDDNIDDDHIYIINFGFLFVCRSRTIFGMKEGAHVYLEGRKHGNMDTGLNMVCT